MVAAVAPYVDTAISKTVNVPADYPYARLRGPVPLGVEVGPEGPGHVPARTRCWARCSAPRRPRRAAAQRGHQRDAAAAGGERRRRAASPTSASRSTARHRGAELAALARPARDARRQPGVDVHDPPPARRVRAVRRRDARAGRPGFGLFAQTCRSRSGSTAPSSRAAWARSPRRCRWTCAPTTRVAQLKLDVLATVAEERAFDMPFPPARRAAPVPRRRRGDGRGDPLALRAARRARPTAARRRCSTRCSAATSRAPAPPARSPGRWTSTTRPPARASC